MQSKLIANRLRELFLDGKWIANTNYKEQIEDIDWLLATKKIENFNSIALLVFHINYYLSGLIRAFETGVLDISDKYSFDMPSIKSEQDWQALKDDFLNNATAFANKVEAMSEEALMQDFIDAKYGTILRNIEGVLEHGYYHLGQIVLIRKMVLNQKF